MGKVIFGGYDVSDQVFFLTRHSFAIVNARPLLRGHVLVCSLRAVDRLNRLSREEEADLFQTVRAVSRSIERFYGAAAMNIAIQDGPIAGQSIPHVHVHIVPRIVGDLPSASAIYKLMNENNFEEAYKEMRAHAELGPQTLQKNRPKEEMIQEAKNLKLYMLTVADPHI